MIWWIIGIYLIILIILLSINSALISHKKRFSVLFTYDVEFAFYEMARSLIEAKDSLYDYDNTLALLYHDKKQIFSKPVKSYEEQFPKIQENISYLEKLLGKKIFTDTFHQKLNQNYQTMQKISSIRRFLHTILTFRTLGIAKLWSL